MDYISEAVLTYATPLYLVDEIILRTTVRRFINAFQTYCQNVQIAYSYKTNPLLAVCQIIHQEGAWAEVVTGDELHTAHKLGMPYSQIVFNGPGKTKDELTLAIANNVILNVDNWHELLQVADIAQSCGIQAKIGLRISTGHIREFGYKFGFDVDNGAADAAIAHVLASQYLELEGFHFHLDTSICDPNSYITALKELHTLIQRHFDPQQRILRYIDIGGGFAVKNNRPLEVTAEDWYVPEIEEFARAICTAVEQLFPPETLLILEPGRALVTDSMLFATKAINIKQQQQRTVIILDGGLNLVPSTYYVAYPVSITSAASSDGSREEFTQPIEFFGSLCMSYDLMSHCSIRKLPEVDDIVVFHNIGAYNYSEAFNFTRGKPPVILIHPDRSFSTIREREPYDLLHSLEYLLPLKE
ncbi:alanine racemase [Nostoc sp. NMS4]|uniref:alanine racemase n=1 Tax=Nostoc sp. NMS4 TaxID=2815390 RepID=UPI0025FBF394|nr:alanine racemase [Nostoc sp. NMS4]MBN3923481.1 alanine racemase [Nostoc sp. NMS4]